jgi:hypothetical protein
MPAGSVPVSAFSIRLLITHTVTKRMPPRRPHRPRPQGAGGAHSRVSAVSAEMLEGTLPTSPGFFAKILHSGTIRLLTGGGMHVDKRTGALECDRNRPQLSTGGGGVGVQMGKRTGKVEYDLGTLPLPSRIEATAY